MEFKHNLKPWWLGKEGCFYDTPKWLMNSKTHSSINNRSIIIWQFLTYQPGGVVWRWYRLESPQPFQPSHWCSYVIKRDILHPKIVCPTCESCHLWINTIITLISAWWLTYSWLYLPNCYKASQPRHTLISKYLFFHWTGQMRNIYNIIHCIKNHINKKITSWNSFSWQL